MSRLLQQRLAELQHTEAAASLASITRGIEKESLRIGADGRLARTPHATALGSALTHPQITTDYSEALLELVTPPSQDAYAPLQWLDRLHRFVHQTLDQQNERMWVNSMPCPSDRDESIPVARYGSSNVGRMKYIYRLGLGHRYGRRMQTIAGIHYNFSYPEQFWSIYRNSLGETEQPLQHFISAQYFGLLRNFQRNAWLLLYLFGASPAICGSFLDGKPHQLLERADNTLFRPHATSLRMSDLGYQNNAQSALQVSLDDLQSYVDTLTYAISTPEPAYQDIGVCTAEGHYKQLNANILQIENEFYSSIRPKRVTQPNERPTLALQRRGVEYIEIRSMDLNPLLPLGIQQADCDFLDLFATYCLLMPAPSLSHCDMSAAKQNIRLVAYDGRQPDLTLWRYNKRVTLSDWANEMFDDMEGLAELFDASCGCIRYRATLAEQRAKVADADKTPSAQVLDQVQKAGGFHAFSLAVAERHRETLLSDPLSDKELQQFAQTAKQSLADQKALEAQTDVAFSDYLAAYFQGLEKAD